MTAPLRRKLFIAAAVSVAALLAQSTVVFKPGTPRPAPPGDVRDIESLTTPPPGFTMQRRNNFYKIGDPSMSLYRWASSGHWSNYDESVANVGPLPDVLTLANGKRVTDAKTWTEQRRPEIIKLYETEIYGKVPASAPKVKWSVTKTETNGATITKEIVGQIGDVPVPPPPAPGSRGPAAIGPPVIRISLTLPANAKGGVPLILGGGGANAQAILDRGWGYGRVDTSAVQRDSADLATLQTGVIGMTLKPGQPRPPDEWGVLRAWSWAMSRAMDYLETDPQVDAKQVAITGHSRFGKMVLITAALDPRFAMVFPTCAGEMGTSLSRHDWGETIDDMVQLFAPHFAGNFVKYAGDWNKLPVDAHMLIALVAPRPVFITGGTTDQWSDPKGEFMAAAAAGPVYKLLGKKDLGATEMPAPDAPLVDGDIAFNEHTGGHLVTPTEWQLFLKFADRYFHAKS